MSRQDQGTGNVAHLAECLQTCKKSRSPSAMPHKPGMVASACNPRTLSVELEGSAGSRPALAVEDIVMRKDCCRNSRKPTLFIPFFPALSPQLLWLVFLPSLVAHTQPLLFVHSMSILTHMSVSSEILWGMQCIQPRSGCVWVVAQVRWSSHTRKNAGTQRIWVRCSGSGQNTGRRKLQRAAWRSDGAWRPNLLSKPNGKREAVKRLAGQGKEVQRAGTSELVS